MKLIAELNGESHEIEIHRSGLDLTALINGQIYELEASQPESDIYLFKYANKTYEIFTAPNENAVAEFNVKTDRHSFEVKIYDPKRLCGAKAAGANNEGISEIKTAMPGKLVRVLTEIGSEIKQGEGVLVVEAMKMQNEMKSPKDGIVKEIRFAEGATVNAGDVLAVIE